MVTEGLADLETKLAAMTSKQRRQRIKQLKKGSDYMTIPEVLEWICLTQEVEVRQADRMLREKLAGGTIPFVWAD